MIDLKAAREAIQGFSGLTGLPDSQEALKARTEALKQNSRSIGHAHRVVKALKDQSRTYPSVQAIVEMCQQTPDDETITAVSRDCAWCNGSGFIIIEGELGISAAWKCRHDGPPPANVGPVIAPSVSRHYQWELAQAEIRRGQRGSVFA